MSDERQRFYVCGLLCFFFFAASLHGQTPALSGMETATKDRLDEPGWWPTKGDPSRSDFVGAAACSRCHLEEARLQKLTPMARAGCRIDKSDVLHRHPSLLLVSAPYTYRISNAGEGIDYSVVDGQHMLAQPLQWAFGAGEFGQTYLYVQNQTWYESEVSYYASLESLDMTTGHSPGLHLTLAEALGRPLHPDDAGRCFACHTTTSAVDRKFDPENAVGGITCEGCHGPGRNHIAKMSAGTQSDADASITNPGRMNPVDSVDFCGACHRTWADVAFSHINNSGLATVRFQPYRLEKSRCWGKNGDVRITCIACHNPHKPLNRDVSSYDGRCRACHASRAAAPDRPTKLGASCPVGANKCVTCHMPKYVLPDMHGNFTDHMIRVVNIDDRFPE